MQLDNEDYRKFTKLYEAFHAPLLNYAGTILRDRYLAEEAVHDAFMRIMKNLDKLSENDCSKTWHYMVKVVKNSSLTALRREKANSHQTLNEGGLNEIADYTEPLWSEYQAKELYQKIKDYILTNLDETDRTIMTLRGVHKMSYKEIAVMTGISEGNVSARLSRLRKKMKVDLKLQEVTL